MKKLILLTLFISGVTLFSFWGSRKMCSLCHISSEFGQIPYADLNLPIAGIKNLKDLEAAFQVSAKELCMKICQERLDVLNMLQDPKARKESIDKKIEEIGTLQTLLEKQIAAHILEVKKGLTPEQTELYLKNIRKELQKSMKQWR